MDVLIINYNTFRKSEFTVKTEFHEPISSDHMREKPIQNDVNGDNK